MILVEAHYIEVIAADHASRFPSGGNALALTRLMVTLLFQTSATDPITFVSSATVFALVAMLASYFPARRAMRINPTEALRTG